jgi:hypothetical protein
LINILTRVLIPDSPGATNPTHKCSRCDQSTKTFFERLTLPAPTIPGIADPPPPPQEIGEPGLGTAANSPDFSNYIDYLTSPVTDYSPLYTP